MNIKIYQIYFLEEHLQKLDSAFVPYDNSFGSPLNTQLREWPIIRETGLEKALQDNANVWGFVSHKFQEKTNTTGTEFIDFIKNNPDKDVWFMEPINYCTNHFNPWHHGDECHTNISKITNDVFNRMGINIDVKSIKMPFCWFNYFAGTEKFWSIYFSVMDEFIKVSMEDEELNKLVFHTSAQYGPDPNVPYFIFIVERMFSTIISCHDDIKAIGYRY